LALVVAKTLYPLGSINHDDAMYAFQGRLLRAGHLSLPRSYAPFRPWASGTRNGHVVLKYTPVWPAMLAVGNSFGSMHIATAAAAAAAAVLTGLLGREVFGRWREGLLAAAVLVLSPLFWFQSGTYLPYVFELALEVAIIWLVVSAMRDGAPRHGRTRMILAGALWGLALFARQYDAVLLAIPLVVVAAIFHRRNVKQLFAWAGWVAVGAALPVIALLGYNAALMGSPLHNTFNVTGPHDTLGFGRRGVFAATEFNFTAKAGAVSVERNLMQLPGWTFGGWFLVIFAAFGFWRSRAKGVGVWAVAGTAISFTVGYAIFWSPYSIVKLWPGARTLGPFYHLVLLVPLAIFAAVALGVLFDRNRIVGALAVALLVVVTGLTAVTRVDRNRNVTNDYRAARRLVTSATPQRGAVLFVADRGEQGFDSATPFLENTPNLDAQRVIYAVEGGPADVDVLARYPNRLGLRLRSELRPGDELLHPTRFVEPVHVVGGTAVPLHIRIVNTVGSPIVVTKLSVGDKTRRIVLDRASVKNARYDVTWTLTNQTPGPGTAAVQAEFVNRNGTSQLYERQYPYVASNSGISVLEPGIGRYYFQYGNKSAWLDQDVTPTLGEGG
jgi:hypothetical protein